MTAPQKLIAKVTTPMMIAGIRTSVDSMDIEMPTTKASMLVATANVAMVTTPISPFPSSSPKKSSLIMLRPIRSRMAKAIQWAYSDTRSYTAEPRMNPRQGIRNWKNPNHAPVVRPTVSRAFLDMRPLIMETANASIARATPRRSGVIMSICPV